MGALGETIDIGSKLFRRLRDDQAILAQAILMRLTTRRGTYWDDPEYGLLVADYLNAGLTPDTLARIPFEVQSELEKDERIERVEVRVDMATATAPAGARLRLTFLVTPATGGPFAFVLAVSELSVDILTTGKA